MYKNLSLKRYLDDLAAKLPTPGGGSAAALSAAMGAALISMVVNFTIGKPKYSGYELELKKILNSSEKLRKAFLDLVDQDVEAYKSKNIKQSLKIPLSVCWLALDALKLCPPLIKKGNRNLISDVAVAAVLLEAAVSTAAVNVRINLANFDDKKLMLKIEKELCALIKNSKIIRTKTEENVGKLIGR